MAEGWEVRLAGVLNEARVPHPCGAAVDYIVRAANYAPEAAREFLELAKGKIEVAIQLCGGVGPSAGSPSTISGAEKGKGKAKGKAKAATATKAKATTGKAAKAQAAFKRCTKCGEAKGQTAFSKGSSVCRMCLKKLGGGLNPDKVAVSTYEDEPELDDMLGSDSEDDEDDTDE